MSDPLRVEGTLKKGAGGNCGFVSETTSGPRHRPRHRGVVLRMSYIVGRESEKLKAKNAKLQCKIQK